MRVVSDKVNASVTGFPVGFFISQMQSAAAGFKCVAGTGTSISIILQPSNIAGGLTFTSQPMVQVVDKAGNVAFAARPTTLTAVLRRAAGSGWSSSNGKLLGNPQSVCSVLTGVCAFSSLGVDRTGTYLLSFTSSSASEANGLNPAGVFSDVFQVLIGAATTAIAVQMPEKSTGGILFSIQPVAAVTDAGGNWVYSATQEVQLAACCSCDTSFPRSCSLNGSLIAASTKGIVSFRGLSSLTTGNNIQLRLRLVPVTAACVGQNFPITCLPGCCADSPQQLNVLTGPPALLYISKQPSATQEGGVIFDFMPVIQVQDAGRNNFTDDGGMSVVAALSVDLQPRLLNPASSAILVLSGTTQVVTSKGIARFTDLLIREAGYGFVIEFMLVRTGRSEVIRGASKVDVRVGAAVALRFRRQPANSAAGVGLLGKPQIVLVDKGGNAVTSVTGVSPTISAWAVADLPECSVLPPALIGDVQHTNSRAVAEISTASVAYPCASVRMRATVSSASFISDSLAFSTDVGPPVNFEVEFVTHDSVALLWRSPITGQQPSAYRLTYGPRPGYRTPGTQDTTIRLPSSSTETRVTGLSPLVAYSFQICSASRYSATAGDSDIVAGQPPAFVEKCATEAPAALVTAAIGQPRLLQVQFVGVDFADLKWWAPLEGAAPPAYRVTVTCNNASSCTDSEYGFEYQAYTSIGSTGYGQSDAPAATIPGGAVTFRVTNLTATKGYIFKVASRAVADDPETTIYAPNSLSVQTIYPVQAPPRNSLTIQCLSLPCVDGTGISVSWQSSANPPSSAASPAPPRSYKLTVGLYDSSTGVASGIYDAGEVAHDNGGAKTIAITSLVKGRLIQVRLYALSLYADYYGPAAEKIFRPISRPSPPMSMRIDVIRNQEVGVSWRPPTDSGDGTPEGVGIARYRLEYRRLESEQWTALPEDNVLTMSIFFLEQGVSYSFNCWAISQQAAEEGGASFRSAPSSLVFYYGRSPFWDAITAPPAINPPAIYFAYIGSPFSMHIKALDSDVTQNVTISATGLSECGAKLYSETKANPATAMLVFFGTPEDCGKTFLICFTAQNAQKMSASPRCFRLSIASPAPRFLSPLGQSGAPDTPRGSEPQTLAASAAAAHVKATVAATAGCPVQIPIVGVDETSARVPPAQAAAHGYMLKMDLHVTVIQTASGGQQVVPGLLQGASLSGDVGSWGNPLTRVLSWTPQRGQDSLVYDFCLTLTDSHGIITEGGFALQLNQDYCIRVRVARCAYCLQKGDSLYSVAEQWRTSWLEIWGGNADILSPGAPPAHAALRMGPIYQAMQHDTLISLAARFGVSVENILFWNPDIFSDASTATVIPLAVDQPICVLPNVCGV